MSGVKASGKKQCGSKFQSSNELENLPDMDREETRKRQLYVLLSIPGIVFLFAFAIYDFFYGSRVGAWFD
jgi:hypothetical protein